MAFQLKNIEKSTKEKTNSFDIDAFLKKDIKLFSNRFSNTKKEDFYTELAVLLNAGLELKSALELIGEEQKKEVDKKLFESIVEELILGKNFSEAIKTQDVFSEYEYYSLQIGEKTGTLKKVCEELGLFFNRKNKQRKAVQSALSYPIIVLITAFLTIFIMVKFVVPVFTDIFKQNNVELPWITQKVVAFSEFVTNYYWVGFLVILVFIILIKTFKNKTWYRKLSSALLLKIPFLGEFTRKVKLAQFTQAIALLTSAKVPLLNGIQLTKKMIRFYPLEMALEKVEEDVLVGKTLHESIKKYKIFDKKMSSLIKVAEETNQTETIFNRLTFNYNQDIENKSKTINAVIEPIFIIFLGAIVTVILVALYLPMFKLSTVLG